MIDFVTFEIPTGRLRGKGSCLPEDLELQRQDGIGAIEVPDRDAVGEGHYFAEGEVRPRPAMPLVLERTTLKADGIDALAISGLPNPCRVTIDGAVHNVEDGSLTLTSDSPHLYAVIFSAWPFLDRTIEIEAV